MHAPDELPDGPDALPGTILPIPVPPDLAEACGYRGAARFVGLYWIPAGDEVVYDDGRFSGTGNTFVFLEYRRHRSVAPVLERYNIGYSDMDADVYLLLDREENRVSVAPVAQARTFLNDQHPPPPELTPYKIEQAKRELDELLSKGWREVQIDPKTIRRAIEQQRQTIARVLAFLDQWHTS